MNKIKVFLTLFFIANLCIKSEAKLKMSLIVPCHPKHVRHLDELLKAYEKQTLLPDEVVISISEANQIDPHIIKSIQNSLWKFSVKIFASNEKLFAGQNRNIACSNATGDVFICQDADDLPHPQRLEIINYFFEKLNLDFLLHKFVYNNENEMKQIQTVEDISSIEHTYLKTYHDAWIVGYILFGQPAIHRRVFEKIKWPDVPVGEDNAFDNKVILSFEKCIMIPTPLYIYRFELSATPYELYRMHKPNEKFL